MRQSVLGEAGNARPKVLRGVQKAHRGRRETGSTGQLLEQVAYGNGKRSNLARYITDALNYTRFEENRLYATKNVPDVFALYYYFFMHNFSRDLTKYYVTNNPVYQSFSLDLREKDFPHCTVEC